MTTPLPGWYPDPAGGEGQKYWDGRAWHADIPTAPLAPAEPVEVQIARAQKSTTKGNPMIRRLALVLASCAGVVAVFGTGLAHANPDVGNADDQKFMESLDRYGVLFSFNLEKMQAQRYCANLIAGTDKWRVVTAIDDLALNGGYSLDVAKGIAFSAQNAYCTCAELNASAASLVTFNGAGVSIGPQTKPPPASLCRQFELEYARQNGIVIPTRP